MAEERKLHYLHEYLPAEILRRSGVGDEAIVGAVTLSTPQHLDGFMSTIHKCTIKWSDGAGSDERVLDLMVKVMKGDDDFRESSKGRIQFSNEIYVYTKVLPVFQGLAAGSRSKRRYDWCPSVLYGDADKYPSYSDQYETILVMENVAPLGYKSGSRISLDAEHLMLMVKNIATFHACTYTLRLKNDPRLSELIQGIIPLNYVEGDSVFTSYDVLVNHGVERVFRYLDDHPDLLDTEEFTRDIANMRNNYGSRLIHLMQKLITRDEIYSVILHGDYNRNNVLFRYEEGKPVDLKMFDFQENRYASPAIDLTFLMYMSTTEEVRTAAWDKLMEAYHSTLLDTLIDLLDTDANDPRLVPYQFDPFMQHLRKYALYGTMVTIHFLPWMICPEDECEQIANLFATDVYSEELKRLTQICGGEEVDKRLIQVLRHASSKGYFDIVNE